jgi:hypothetical protein
MAEKQGGAPVLSWYVKVTMLLLSDAVWVSE